ncbi:MAG: OsmC family peroxiredoxin [Thermomicrobiales bacterium]
MVEKTASAVWNGTLVEGSGSFSLESGVLADSPLTWAARTGAGSGKTSPEELIAAAHASCYAMAFTHMLANAGTPAERLDVSSSVGFGPNPGGGMKVTHSHLTVKGTVPGLDQAAFAEAAKNAEQDCPVSNALRNNIEITVEATLA